MYGPSLKPKQSLDIKTVIIAIIFVLFIYSMIKYSGNGESSAKTSTRHPALVNGDNVFDIIIDNSDNYNIVFGEDEFNVNINDDTVCKISVMNIELYNDYVEYAKYNNLTTLYEQEKNGNIQYIFYLDTMYGENNFIYLFKIEGLDYIIKLYSNIDKRQAEACYDKITFDIK